ncbi:MAG: YdcF family protein [Verrucomicrobiae bacterium]|nr:YdcF family protein [Verrucomicrobiae bacterium]
MEEALKMYVFKLAPQLVLPLGLGLSLLLVSVLLRSRAWGLAAFAWLFLSSTGYFAECLLKPLEDAFPRLRMDDCPAADAVVVLGGILAGARNTAEHSEWGSAVDRFEEGVALWHARKAPLLIFTGGRLPWSEEEYSESSILKVAAARRGVRPDAIVELIGAPNTEGEVSRLLELNERVKVARIILVTTAWHMPRAELLFRQGGFDVIAFPVDYMTHERIEPGLFGLLPAPDALQMSHVAIREYLGLLYYKLAGVDMAREDISRRARGLLLGE